MTHDNPNMFAEGTERYHHDPEFHAAVDMLRHFALKHGFSPYELKQIAHMAAVINEANAVRIDRGELSWEAERFCRSCGSLLGHPHKMNCTVYGDSLSVLIGECEDR